jgi:hypothetical protein
LDRIESPQVGYDPRPEIPGRKQVCWHHFTRFLLEGLYLSAKKKQVDERVCNWVEMLSKGRLIRSFSPKSFFERRDQVAHVKERVVASKSTERLGGHDMSERCHILTDLAVIALVGQIRGLAQLGGLGHELLDDFHLEKPKVPVTRLIGRANRTRVTKDER